MRVAGLQRGDDPRRLVHAQGGLGQEGELRVGREGQGVDVGHVLDQDHAGRGLAHGADDLVVPLVADQDDGVPVAGEAHRLGVDLGHQRAGGVDGAEVAPGRVLADLRGDAVGAVEDRGAGRDLGDVFDEDDALGAEPLDDGAVVDDLVVDVDRGAELAQGGLQGVDGHVDAGTEAARVGEDDLHRSRPPSGCRVGPGSGHRKPRPPCQDS